MAFTLNNFYGAETQGGEEFGGVGGTPTFETGGDQRTDAAAMKTISASFTLLGFDFIADAGDRQCIGFGFLVPTSFAGGLVFRAQDGGSRAFDLNMGGVDNKFLRLLDTGGSQIGLGTTQLVVGTQYFIEVVWQHLDSAEIEVFLDGSSEITATGADLTAGASFTHYLWNSVTHYLDDVYIASGLAGVGDRLSATKAAPYFEVYGYQPTKASAVPDAGLDGNAADNLDTGNWNDAGETPANDTNTAQYTGDGGLYGTVDLPAFGAEIDSDAGIIGIKGIYRLKKGATGAATVHKTGLGDSGDGNNAANVTRSLTTTYVIYETLRTTDLPTKAQKIRMGFSTSGEQDIICAEMWAMVAHAPPLAGFDDALTIAAAATLATVPLGDQGGAASLTADAPVVITSIIVAEVSMGIAANAPMVAVGQAVAEGAMPLTAVAAMATLPLGDQGGATPLAVGAALAMLPLGDQGGAASLAANAPLVTLSVTDALTDNDANMTRCITSRITAPVTADLFESPWFDSCTI